MKLRWVKIAAGVWVDRDAFYCIRRFTDIVADADAYEASEAYPRCLVEALGAAASLPEAKRLCHAHADELFSEEAA